MRLKHVIQVVNEAEMSRMSSMPVNMLYENRLSISYDRVLEISSNLAEAVVNQYVEGVVCQH